MMPFFSDGSFGLESDNSDYTRMKNGARVYSVFGRQLDYEWSDGTNSNPGRNNETMDGTFSFRLHLNSSNIRQ